MPERYLHMSLCFKKHEGHPFNHNKIDGSDTCCVDLINVDLNTPGLRDNDKMQEMPDFCNLWLQAMNASFDAQLDLPDDIPSGMIEIHRHGNCDRPLRLKQLRGTKGNYTTSFQTIPSDEWENARIACVHINKDGPFWKQDTGADTAEPGPGNMRKKEEDLAPKYVQMQICTIDHPDAPFGPVEVNINPKGQLITSMDEASQQFAERMRLVPEWPQLDTRKVRWQFHGPGSCQNDDLTVDDLVENFLCNPETESDEGKVVHVHLREAGRSSRWQRKAEPRDSTSRSKSARLLAQGYDEAAKNARDAKGQSIATKKTATSITQQPSFQNDPPLPKKDAQEQRGQQSKAQCKDSSIATADPPALSPPPPPPQPERSARDKSRSTKVKPKPCDGVDQHGNPDFPETNDENQIIRVGRIKSEDDAGDDTLPMRMVVVAVVKGKKVGYLKVPTWTINGQQIGAYSFGRVNKSLKSFREFEADPFWKSARGNIDQAILQYISNGLQPAPERDVSDCVRVDGGDNGARTPPPDKAEVRPFRPPVRPVHTEGVPASQIDGEKPDGHDDISAVVCLANYTGEFLKLPSNIQGWLDSSESQASFVRWLEDEPLFPEESTELTLSNYPYKKMLWLDWDVWVLPQWEEDQLYPWMAGDGRNAEDFLDPYVTSVWGRQLFFLVRVRGHPDGERLDEEWAADNARKRAEAKAAKSKAKRNKSSGKK